jgi:hypothetical protein
MDSEDRPENDVTNQFRMLAQNLARTLNAAWESPERKRLQSEIEQGLAELTATLKREANAFEESPTGQRMKENVQELGQRVTSPETEDRVRQEILKALRSVNSELEKTAQRWESRESGSEPTEESNENV